MDGIIGLGLHRFEVLTRPSGSDRRLVTRALGLTFAMAVLTVGALLTLDALGVSLPVVTEFPTLLDGGLV